MNNMYIVYVMVGAVNAPFVRFTQKKAAWRFVDNLCEVVHNTMSASKTRKKVKIRKSYKGFHLYVGSGKRPEMEVTVRVASKKPGETSGQCHKYNPVAQALTKLALKYVPELETQA